MRAVVIEVGLAEAPVEVSAQEAVVGDLAGGLAGGERNLGLDEAGVGLAVGRRGGGLQGYLGDGGAAPAWAAGRLISMPANCAEFPRLIQYTKRRPRVSWRMS